MLTDIKVDLFREELYIAFLFLIFFCELAYSNSLINRAGLITGMQKKQYQNFIKYFESDLILYY